MGDVVEGRFESVSAEVPQVYERHIEGARFGGGEGGGPMDPISGKDYVDAKVSELRAESRADLAEIKSLIETKSAAIEVKLAALDKLPTSVEFFAGLATAAFTIVGLILAVLSFTGARSDAAAGWGAAIQRAQGSADANSSSVERVRSDLDKLEKNKKH